MSEDSIIEILDISLSKNYPHLLWGCHLDRPKIDTQIDSYTSEISGWVLAKSPAVSLEILCEGRLIQKIPINISRPDVVKKLHPQRSGAENCGFRTELGVIGLPQKTQLRLRVILEDGRGFPLGNITFQHKPLHTNYKPKLQPLLITSTGRSGTTWLMRLLSNHPQIIISKNYPYENRAALYWMQMLKALSQPLSTPVSNAEFDEEKNWLGRNALYNPNISSPSGVAWVKREYPQLFAAFCQECIDNFYQKIAESQGQDISPSISDKHSNPSSVTYFAEKNPFEMTPLMEVYPHGREIILVRDFRDMICSILAFNNKRGFDDFGRQNFGSDEDYIRAMGKQIVRDLPKGKKHLPRTHLVRYEDLILMPQKTLGNLLQNLGLEHSPSVVERMLEKALEDNPQLKGHRTSSDPKESIGRWQKDLEPYLQNLCTEIFSEMLQEFGYITK